MIGVLINGNRWGPYNIVTYIGNNGLWALGKVLALNFDSVWVRNFLSPVFAYIGYRISSRRNTSREYFSEETFLSEKSMQNLSCTIWIL